VGILGAHVKIELRETLLRGHDHFTLTVTLPLVLEGRWVQAEVILRSTPEQTAGFAAQQHARI
jgi:hypothetical protein